MILKRRPRFVALAKSYAGWRRLGFNRRSALMAAVIVVFRPAQVPQWPQDRA
jgi:hypothetical protein